MPDSTIDLPEVEARDPEPVAAAIETARDLFRKGDRLESLRWLRRAAERAEESGDDIRAVHLARSAADLSTELQSVPPPPTSVAPPPPPSPMPTTASLRHDAGALASYDDFSDKTQVDATAPPIAREVLHSSVQITELPESQPSPRSITMPSPPAGEHKALNVHFARDAGSIKPTATRKAVRVAITHDPDSPGIWLVRPLAEDSPVPAGCEEALLIALNPKSNLFG